MMVNLIQPDVPRRWQVLSVSKMKMETILYIHNMNDEVRFYRDVLGLSILYPTDLEDYSGEMWVEFECGDAMLALHGGAGRVPDDLHEIVFWVEDAGRAREEIMSAGIHMNPVRDLEDGALIAEGSDPNGHRFAIRSH